MKTDLNTLLTTLYVHLDDRILPGLGFSRDRHPGRKPVLSDIELPCLLVAQQLLGIASDRKWIRYAHKHLKEMLIAAIPVLPLIAAAIATAIIAIGTTGSLIRWLPEATPKRALFSAVSVAITCILGDLTMLAILALRGPTASVESSALPLAIIAIAASAIRLVGAAWLVRRCLHARAALMTST